MPISHQIHIYREDEKTVSPIVQIIRNLAALLLCAPCGKIKKLFALSLPLCVKSMKIKSRVLQSSFAPLLLCVPCGKIKQTFALPFAPLREKFIEVSL
jgi:hypothetical protein